MTAGGGPGSRRSPEHALHRWSPPSPEGLSACSRCGLLSRVFPDGSRATFAPWGDGVTTHGGLGRWGDCLGVLAASVMES